MRNGGADTGPEPRGLRTAVGECFRGLLGMRKNFPPPLGHGWRKVISGPEGSKRNFREPLPVHMALMRVERRKKHEPLG